MKLWLVLAVLAALSACARPDRPSPRPGASAAAPAPGAPAPTAPAHVKIGRPYIVFGRTYVPADDRHYDQIGVASWYGPGFHGRPTANGERYDERALTAAHPTLPMPSWVEVHNLDNGRRATLRINDRGPFVDGRVIDLSRASAQLLGMEQAGLARVRVRRVFPPGDWALAEPPRPAPPVRAAPVLAGAPSPSASGGVGWVQVAALSDRGRAEGLASALADHGPTSVSATSGGLWRVRLGPLADVEAALGRLRAEGYVDAMRVGAP